ncbi:MAG: hypothetical protein RIA65_14770 [Woeseia sp.]
MKTSLTMAALLLTGILAAGCDNDGPMENAGEAIDEAATDIGNATEDACEDIKEGAGAEDTNC